MYIARVRMQGFMRYEDESVELGPGFNAFTGPTDSGKSTVLRALIWVMYNRPSGSSVIRQGSKETAVTITTSTGHVISRVRNASVNGYILDGTTYTATGTSVPEEVQAALNIRAAELGPKVTEPLNVSRQMDGPFMLSDTGANAAKILGNLSGISSIDAAISSTKADVSAAKKEIDAQSRIEKGAELSLQEFKGLDEEQKALELLRDRLDSAQNLQARSESLTKLIEQMESINETRSTIQDRIRRTQEDQRNLEKVSTYRGQLDRYQSLEALRVSMESTNAYRVQVLAEMRGLETKRVDLNKQKHELLVAYGKCPTCGTVQR